MLKKLRVTISLLIFIPITFYFLDFRGVLPQQFHWLAKIQLVPALLSLNLIILLVIVGITLLFGRIYCSSVCPLGIFQDIVSWVSKHFNKKKKFRFSSAKNILRWSIFGIIVITFFLGFSFLTGFFDPYSIYGRISTHLFKPVYMEGNNLLAGIFNAAGFHSLYKVQIFMLSISTFLITLSMLLIIVYLSWKDGRLYCNTICPVGTTLGFLSKYSLFKIRFDQEQCNSCGLCSMKCKSSCIDAKNKSIDNSRCVNCFNCIEACNRNALKFAPKFATQRKKVENESATDIDENKRRFLSTLAVSSLAVAALPQEGIKINGFHKMKRETPISPPGSKSAENLMSACTSCHLCVSKCPSQIIRPSLFEYGLGGIMQPMLSFEKGFCNYDCTICTEVCPSGALLNLTKEEKHKNQMGQVHFILENCIVYKDGTSCGACSEHCPTQAVSMVPYKNELTIPHTDTSICVGCGACEYACPTFPDKAIYVEGIRVHQQADIKKEKTNQKINIEDFGF
jgi:polyferredoxin